ncbi:MAG: hypothetical protein ABFD60_04320 [Bryobacteraceae bacterium]
MPVRKIRPESEALILRMIEEQGLGVNDVAKELGVTKPTVYAFLRERGYEQAWVKRKKKGAGTSTATAPTTSTLGEIAPAVSSSSVSEPEPVDGDAVEVGSGKR